MNREVSRTFDKLDCFRAGLVQACMGLHLFGDRTQAVIDLCDAIDIPTLKDAEAVASGVTEFQRLGSYLRADLDSRGTLLDDDFIVEAFWLGMNREIGIIKKAAGNGTC